MIYLDSAATSFLKPPQVGRGVMKALSSCSSPGRGAYSAAMYAADVVLSCRETAARLFHVPKPEQIVFTSSATHGLNIAIRSLVHPGDRVVISGYEHNAVTRPLYALGADIDIVSTRLFSPEEMISEFEKKIPGASAVVCTHVSNVFGYVLPVEEISRMCRLYRVPCILDASQSAGLLNIDFSELSPAFIAMPGHKGLLGPQGTGLLLCNESGVPLIYGGTGGFSLQQDMPEDLPERLEAGTLNVCGIAGLLEGMKFVLSESPNRLRAQEIKLMRETIRQLSGCNTIQLYYSDNNALHCGVLSMISSKYDCEVWAEKLASCGVAARAGLHCAPLAHKTAGTLDVGTLRISFSPFNTSEEIRAATGIMRKI